MFDFITQLGYIIVSIIDYVVNGVKMLISLFLTVPRALLFIIQAVGYLPPYVSSIIFVSIAVSVILFLVNHGGD